ncbi:hypothetical protein EEGS01_47750 (plasmid) [Escherichia coli]|nr:hypothetical protein EEGS01_47750 [Escherichia coli]
MSARNDNILNLYPLSSICEKKEHRKRNSTIFDRIEKLGFKLKIISSENKNKKTERYFILCFCIINKSLYWQINIPIM